MRTSIPVAAPAVYACAVMQSFAVVLALLATAALGWALSALARRVLRRFGVRTEDVPEDRTGRG